MSSPGKTTPSILEVGSKTNKGSEPELNPELKIVDQSVVQENGVQSELVLEPAEEPAVGKETNAPEEMFQAETGKKKDYRPPYGPPQERFSQLVKTYFERINPELELEVRFWTRSKMEKALTKNDYDNVIQKLKSSGFQCFDESGKYSLRIQNDFMNIKTGRFETSKIRTEIDGLDQIQLYCATNDITKLHQYCVQFNNKRYLFEESGDRIQPVNFDDFNFRITLQKEEKPGIGVQRYIKTNLMNAKKEFRYMNRVTFTHPVYPVKVDISIVKYGTRDESGFVRKVRTPAESNVFNNPDVYEIEIECDNTQIGPDNAYNNPAVVLDAIRKVIKLVLSGLQGTNYPVSYPIQTAVLGSYLQLISSHEKRHVDNSDFIGPNSITLQMENIAQADENSTVTNIRKDYTVTDKADGDRHLLYVHTNGHIYLINTNMKVIFTGAKTSNKECFNMLIDGELITHDKNREFINLYAAFDIYYYTNRGQTQDVRHWSFIPVSKSEKADSRLYLLKRMISMLKPVSVETKSTEVLSPIRIVAKEFYSQSGSSSIFDGCNKILTKKDEGGFVYETDGLIFTPSYLGVGSDKVGVAGPNKKVTWRHSFKWKPPEYNSVDFLVTTIKNSNGDDVVKNLFEDGMNVGSSVQATEYKTVQLRCSFNKNIHGYINPCQDVIDDILPEPTRYSDKKSLPVIFCPTDPYDPDAGICNIQLKKGGNNVSNMFTEEHDAFGDNTIVEFRYELGGEAGWRWKPIRVRHDKTLEMLKGTGSFGNAYHVANDNWKSIHNPIREDMIRSGTNIPDILTNEDKYYNDTAGRFKTESMKAFHNMYVKKTLDFECLQRG